MSWLPVSQGARCIAHIQIPLSFTDHSHPADSVFKLIPWRLFPIVVPHERSPSDRFRKWFNYRNHTHISVNNSFNDLATCTNDTGCCSRPSAGRLNKGHPEKGSVILALLTLTRFERTCDTYGACMRPHKGKRMSVKRLTQFIHPNKTFRGVQVP